MGNSLSDVANYITGSDNSNNDDNKQNLENNNNFQNNSNNQNQGQNNNNQNYGQNNQNYGQNNNNQNYGQKNDGNIPNIMKPTGNPVLEDAKVACIAKLKEGKTRYESSSDIATKKQGYQAYIDGIELMIELRKHLTNDPYTHKMVSGKITEFLKEAKKMKMGLQQNNNGNYQAKNVSAILGNQTNYNKNNNFSANNLDPENAKYKEQVTNAIISKRPSTNWDSIAGLENAKDTLKEAIHLPLKHPQIFEGVLTPWKGILQYGPPGTGKTMLGEACANFASATFFNIVSSDITSKYVGESEKIIKALFSTAREKKPSIIFIDEIDSLVSKRNDNEQESSRRVKNQLFQEIEGLDTSNEGVTNGVVVIAATNFPWNQDPAMRRRFEKRVYIPLPDKAGIKYILEKSFNKISHNQKKSDITKIAKELDGFSGSDVAAFVKEACLQPLNNTLKANYFKKVWIEESKENGWMACNANESGAMKMELDSIQGDNVVPPPVQQEDLYYALENSKKSVSQANLNQYKQFTKQFGMEG